VTRDAKEKIVEIYNKKAVLIDSPGMFDYGEYNDDPELLAAISKKLDELVNSSNLMIFVLDGVTGISDYDRDIANLIRKSGKEVIVAVNKSERKSSEYSYVAATEFGFQGIYKISAEHGLGIGELLDAISEHITDQQEELIQERETIKLAIIGKPNVGKSTMINTILGEEKQLVADYSGLTRESAEYIFKYGDEFIKLIDTTGIRRQNRVSDILERISVSNARKSYKNADAVILMIDATTLESGKIEKQDLTLAAEILKYGKALTIAFNKVDKTPYEKDACPPFLRRNFRDCLSQLKDVPFLFVSAINHTNINNMLETVISVYEKQKIKIKTSELNDWLHEVGQSGLMQSSSAKFKLKYITQVSILPPTFLIFVTNGSSVRKDHERFLTNSFRNTFDIQDAPINIVFREVSSRSHRLNHH
jgi:GTP-binding protein